LPFLIHALVNALIVLVLHQPVSGLRWSPIDPRQNMVALPILTFAFVIKTGPTLSLVLPLVVELIVVAAGAALLIEGLRTLQRAHPHAAP